MTAGQSETIRNHAVFIRSVADLLRGDYKQSEYGKVILPLTVLRRFDCVLAPTKDAVLERAGPIVARPSVSCGACRQETLVSQETLGWRATACVGGGWRLEDDTDWEASWEGTSE